MKYKIHNNLETKKLKDIVPTAYRDLEKMLEPKLEGMVTLIVFPHNRNDVVKSTLVNKALNKINLDAVDNLVALGGCFTKESVAILKSCGAMFLNLSEFNWTDERYNTVHSGEPKR